MAIEAVSAFLRVRVQRMNGQAGEKIEDLVRDDMICLLGEC